MDQLDISNFNPTDPTDDRGNPAYVKKMRRWMETQGNRAEQYAEFREQQQTQQAGGDSSWLYEAKQRAREQALADVKRQNRQSMWGAVFNLREIVPAKSLADNYLGAAEEAVAAAQLQGPLNIANGLTDLLVDTANMDAYVKSFPTIVVAAVVNAAAGEAVLPTEIVQLPKVDFSLGLFVDEDPYWHGWSKWLGATGVTMLLPGDELAVAANALKGTGVGPIFTGVSKASQEVVEAVVSQAKGLVPKALGKVRLPRSTARAGQVAEGIGGASAGVAPRSRGWRAAANTADELADAPFAPGSAGAAKTWTSIKSRLKAAQLPTSGKIRFVPPKNYNPSSPLTRGPNNGYLDRFGNEWVRGPSRTAGEAFEWDVQLSNRGREMLRWLSREGNHVNVSLGGIVTH